MSDKSSERRMMVAASTIEMQGLLHRIAGEAGSVKARIRLAAIRVGLSFSRTRDLWYADRRRRVDPEELDKARMVAKTNNRAEHNELAELRARVARLEALLAVRSPGQDGAGATH